MFGRNYDWVTGNGMVVVNGRGVFKTSMVGAGEKPVSWTSKWGSISFNQFGKEGEYKYVTQIHKVDLSTNAAPVQMTFGKESSSQPAWSPDDKTLAFVRVVDSKPQVFLLPISGG